MTHALAVLNAHSLQQFMDFSLVHRADYLAAKKRETEQKTLLTPAQNALRPQVNLSLSSGYSSLDEGTGVLNFFSAPGRAPRGPDVGVGVTYQFPPSNNAAHRSADAGAIQRSASRVAHPADVAKHHGCRGHRGGGRAQCRAAVAEGAESGGRLPGRAGGGARKIPVGSGAARGCPDDGRSPDGGGAKPW